MVTGSFSRRVACEELNASDVTLQSAACEGIGPRSSRNDKTMEKRVSEVDFCFVLFYFYQIHTAISLLL